MSDEEDISTLFTRDLDTTKESEIWSDDIRKIINENQELRCFLHNANLRAAKIIGDCVLWMDSMSGKFQCCE
jgi:hypothetical protein